MEFKKEEFQRENEPLSEEMEEEESPISNQEIEEENVKPIKRKVKKVQIPVKSHKKHHQSVLDEEFDIKFKPRQILKYLIIILLFTVIFFVGRFSVGDCTIEQSTTAEVVDNLATEGTNPSFSTKVSGFFTSLFSGSEESSPETVDKSDPITTESDEITAAITNNTTKTTEEVSEEETATVEEDVQAEEVIITKYSKVGLAIKDVKFDWKGTWGKITNVGYTIKNSEEGIIKPDYFIMTVEGYSDIEKNVPLPATSKKIPAKSLASSSAIVPKGFAYSELSAGDLTNVEIILTLYDADNKLMATHKITVDISSK